MIIFAVWRKTLIKRFLGLGELVSLVSVQFTCYLLFYCDVFMHIGHQPLF